MNHGRLHLEKVLGIEFSSAAQISLRAASFFSGKPNIGFTWFSCLHAYTQKIPAILPVTAGYTLSITFSCLNVCSVMIGFAQEQRLGSNRRRGTSQEAKHCRSCLQPAHIQILSAFRRQSAPAVRIRCQHHHTQAQGRSGVSICSLPANRAHEKQKEAA